MLLTGREPAFLRALFAGMSATPGAISDADIVEFARTYSRTDDWRGAIGLYQSMLREGAEIQALVDARALQAPVLAVGAGGGAFTADTMARVAATPIRSVTLAGVGHDAALGAPNALADDLLDFITSVETA